MNNIKYRYIGMTSIKFITSQAECINQYKNLRIDVLKCCTNMCFAAAKHRTHTHSRALLATYRYATRHAATEPGLYNENNQ